MRHLGCLDEFARYCFPQVAYLPFNAFHNRILKRSKVHWRKRARNQSRAYAAPRGIAKSTLTKIDVAHDICFGLERVIMVLSATRPDAWAWSKTVKGWFEDKDSDLQRLYGPFVVKGGQEEFHITGPRGTVSIASRSFKSDVRGYNVNAIRPTRVIIDDGESRKEVDNPSIRRKWQNFIAEDVLKLGPRTGGTLYDWLGTVLHPDSILNRILKRKAPNLGWRSEKFQALISWPDNPGMWERCREIYADLDATRATVPEGALAEYEDLRVELDEVDAARLATSRYFYETNREAMDAGAEVLDEHALPLFEIYIVIWDEGLPAMLKELNNDPSDPSERIFDSRGFKRCEYDLDAGVIVSSSGKRILLSECDVATWLDPIPAESTGNDYASVAVVAKHRRTRQRFALTCSLEHISPAQQRARVWAAYDLYGRNSSFRRRLYSYENNGFQKLMMGEPWVQEQERRARERLSGDLMPVGYPSTENKIRRMSRLQPDTINGYLEFSQLIPDEVLEQFDELPGASHDDGPDAIERADWLLQQDTMPRITRTGRP